MAQESIGVDICLAGGASFLLWGEPGVRGVAGGCGFFFFPQSWCYQVPSKQRISAAAGFKILSSRFENGSSLDGGSSERRLVETAARRNSGFEQQPLRTEAPQNSSRSEQRPLRTAAPQNSSPSEQQPLRTAAPQNSSPSEQQPLRTAAPQNSSPSEQRLSKQMLSKQPRRLRIAGYRKRKRRGRWRISVPVTPDTRGC